jgi:hypothetical protein
LYPHTVLYKVVDDGHYQQQQQQQVFVCWFVQIPAKINVLDLFPINPIHITGCNHGLRLNVRVTIGY